MSTFSKLTLTATFALASVLTYSCSSGDDDGGGNNGGISISDLPKQVYLDGAEYNGNGDIYFLNCYYENDNRECETVSAGKIESGQVVLDLPTSVNGRLAEPEFENNEYCQGNFSYPKNLSIDEISGFYVMIPGKICNLNIRMIKSGEEVRASFLYFSVSGKVTGAKTCTYPDGESYRYEIDWIFSKGWNFCYGNDDHHLTTDLSNDDRFEWRLSCHDDGYGKSLESKSLTKQLFTP